MGKIRKGRLPALFLPGQRLYPGRSLLLKGRIGFLRGNTVCLQKDVTEVNIVFPLQCICRFFLRQIIGQLRKVHICPVQLPGHLHRTFHIRAKGTLRQFRRIGAVLLPGQFGQRILQTVQIGLVHGIWLVIWGIAVQHLRRRHPCHILLMQMIRRLVGILKFHRNVFALFIQRRRRVPHLQRLPQEILLPAGNGMINRTTLYIQRNIKIRHIRCV